MDPEIVFQKAIRALAAGEDPEEVRQAVLKRTGQSLEALGERFGQVAQGRTSSVEPSPERQSGLGNAVRLVSQGATMRFADDAAGAGAALGTLLPGGRKPSEFRDAYTSTRDAVREDMAQAAEETGPVGSFLLEGAGAVIPGGIAAARSVAGKALPQVAKRMAGIGATEGALYGAGGAETLADVPGDALTGLLIGGGTAGALPIAGALGKEVAKRTPVIGPAARSVMRRFSTGDTPLGEMIARVREEAKRAGRKLSDAEIETEAATRLVEAQQRITRTRGEAGNAGLLKDPTRQRLDDLRVQRQEVGLERDRTRLAQERPTAPLKRPSELGMTPRASASPEGFTGPGASFGGTRRDRLSAARERMAQRAEREPRRPQRAPRASDWTTIPDVPIGSTPDARAMERAILDEDVTRRMTGGPTKAQEAMIAERLSGTVREQLAQLREMGIQAYRADDKELLRHINAVLAERDMRFDWPALSRRKK